MCFHGEMWAKKAGLSLLPLVRVWGRGMVKIAANALWTVWSDAQKLPENALVVGVRVLDGWLMGWPGGQEFRRKLPQV
ncbi:MAG: hypothetical protein RLZZ436_4614 [Planctomycetota bacterium]